MRLRDMASSAVAIGLAGILLLAGGGDGMGRLFGSAAHATEATDGIETADVEADAPDADLAWDAETDIITPELTQAAAGNVLRRDMTIRRGSTLMDALVASGVSRSEGDAIIAVLRDVFDPRKLRADQPVTLLFDPGDDGRRLIGLEFQTDPVHRISVSRLESGGFRAGAIEKAVQRRTFAATGVIRSSLYEAGTSAGVPVPVMMDMMRVYSYDVDFQRDFQPGDRFTIFYERFVTEDGRTARGGNILYADLTLSGRELPLYSFRTGGGALDHFNRAGESVRKSLLRTPIDGARLTSSFGRRKHPILGYSKMHKGADFGAPSGTPIYAAGNGVIDEIGGKGAYGNYIRIRHNSEIATAYAHLSRFARGAGRGSRVDQGEVIGYVGTTGRSTGPHLHYEVLRHGTQVNPMSVKMPTGRKLAGPDLQAFQQAAAALDQEVAMALSAVQIADAPKPSACEGNQTC